jgi:hypothetical protein
MNDKQIQYYFEMKKRGRLIHLSTVDGRNGMLTYFIGNGKPEKYQNREMWSVIDDEEKTGDTIYCDQLITDHNEENPYVAFSVWKDIKRYFKEKYPNIDKIRWVRFRHDRLTNYKEELNG